MPEPSDVQPPSDVEGSVWADREAPADSRRRAEREGAVRQPSASWPDMAVAAPLLGLAAASVAGYALGSIIHRRPPPRRAPAAPAPPRPERERMTAYRGPSPARDERSAIRFR